MAENAYVTTDADFRLTSESRVYVLPLPDEVAPLVQARSEAGGVLFWYRVNDALNTVGWQVADSAGDRGRHEDVTSLDLPYTHVVHFTAVPKEPS